MEARRTETAARTPRQRFWLEHLNACREQRRTLKAYAAEHGLSVSALYAAKATLKRAAASCAPQNFPSRSTLVPVRLAPASAVVRVRLPNGVVVELPESLDPERCRALLASAGALP